MILVPLKMDIALPVSTNSKMKIKISCNSRNSFVISQCLSFAPRTRTRRLNQNYPSHESSVLKLYSSKTYVKNAVVRTSQNEQDSIEASSEESKNKIIPSLSQRGARFKEEFLSKIVPWEKIPVSFDNFPHYIDDHTKAVLMECVASHLKQKKFRKYGGLLKYSSNRIQLQSMPGTDLYRERLVSAVARELQVPLLKLDSSVLPPYDISQTAESEEDSSDSDQDSDYSNDDCCGYCDEDDDSDEADDTSDTPDGVCQLKKGDRVKYVGNTTSIEEVKSRTLSQGDRGEVHQVNGDKVAVIFNDCGLERKEAEEEEEEEKNTETSAQIVTWLDAKNVTRDDNAQMHDCFIAMELLYEVLESGQPIVVYFPDSFFSNLGDSLWDRYKFVEKAETMFDKLTGCVVLICGKNEREVGPEEIEKFPNSLKQYVNKLKDATISQYRINELFPNVMRIKPPKTEDLDKFIKQIEEDRTTVISQVNSSTMHQVLKSHRLLCMDLKQATPTDMILKRKSN